MLFLLFFIMNILPIKNTIPTILKFKKIQIDEQMDKTEIALSLLYKYSTTIYIGHPPQKISKSLLEFNKNYTLMILAKESEFSENTCDIENLNDIYNNSYYRDIDSEIIEYSIINTSFILGTQTNIGNILYNIQYKPDIIYPNSAFVNLDYLENNILFEYINDEEYFIYCDVPLKNYDLRYKDTNLKNILGYIKINEMKNYHFQYYSLRPNGFITLNTDHMYYYFFDILNGCSYEVINGFNYYFCEENKDLSKLKIELGDIILYEEDLVFKINKYKIPLVRFGQINDKVIYFGIFLIKSSLYINREVQNHYYKYITENSININLNEIDSIPFHNSFNFVDKSVDGEDVLPIRFIYKIDKINLDNLDIHFEFKNTNYEFLIEVIIVNENFIELLSKGILIENLFNEKLIFNSNNFSINKYKISSFMNDNEEEYYIYFIVKKNNDNESKFNSLNMELMINYQNDDKLDYGKTTIGQLGNLNEIQLGFKENNILLRKDLEEDELNKVLIIQITLENNLDFCIINKTLLILNQNNNYFYKNSSNFKFIEEYSDKIIIYINLFNRNIDDLILNIYKKNFGNMQKNSGYKIKYNIGNIFDFPYYKIINNKKITYEKLVLNDKMSLKIKIPNIKIIYDNIIKGYANSTFNINIFELTKYFDINIIKPIIFTGSYIKILSIEFNSTDEDIISQNITEIKIDKNKKYLVTAYGNITDYDDIIEYDSFLIEFDEEQDKNTSNISLILGIIIPLIIVILIVVIILYRQHKFCFKKENKLLSQKENIELKTHLFQN